MKMIDKCIFRLWFNMEMMKVALSSLGKQWDQVSVVKLYRERTYVEILFCFNPNSYLRFYVELRHTSLHWEWMVGFSFEIFYYDPDNESLVLMSLETIRLFSFILWTWIEWIRCQWESVQRTWSISRLSSPQDFPFFTRNFQKGCFIISQFVRHFTTTKNSQEKL